MRTEQERTIQGNYDPNDWDEEAEDLNVSEDDDYQTMVPFIGLIVLAGAVSLGVMALIFMHNTYGPTLWPQ